MGVKEKTVSGSNNILLMNTKERIANSISHAALLAIKGVVDIEDPVELNALVIVMNSGAKYRLTIEDEDKEDSSSFYYNV